MPEKHDVDRARPPVLRPPPPRIRFAMENLIEEWALYAGLDLEQETVQVLATPMAVIADDWYEAGYRTGQEAASEENYDRGYRHGASAVRKQILQEMLDHPEIHYTDQAVEIVKNAD